MGFQGGATSVLRRWCADHRVGRILAFNNASRIVNIKILAAQEQARICLSKRRHDRLTVASVYAGIGAHACVQLAKAGWAVVASVFTEEQSHALRERTRLYKAVHVVMLDVTSTRSIEQVKSYIVTEAIPLVALVNNAAIGSYRL